MAAKTPGLAYDKVLSSNTNVTFDFRNDKFDGTFFTLEVMAVFDENPVTIP